MDIVTSWSIIQTHSDTSSNPITGIHTVNKTPKDLVLYLLEEWKNCGLYLSGLHTYLETINYKIDGIDLKRIGFIEAWNDENDDDDEIDIEDIQQKVIDSINTMDDFNKFIDDITSRDFDPTFILKNDVINKNFIKFIMERVE